MQISRFFMNGDIKGAIAYMRSHEEFNDVLPAYVALSRIANIANMIYRMPSTVSCVCIRYIYATPFTAVFRNRKRQTSCWQG